MCIQYAQKFVFLGWQTINGNRLLPSMASLSCHKKLQALHVNTVP